LRAVQQKRGDGSLLTSILGSSKRRPYVITVMGINGIGKTTTLAKLAYYFVQNGCKPMLVAGDTFRSGAVEQLQVHADCLGIPLFQQGYSKNPSAVAAAAIAHANKPDCCLMVCEALVGHDGVSQYQMFRQAAGRVDGLILTKFDTVDTKMGACLTLTHECGAPIVFLGVGQKYHHLQPLHVSTVVKSLLS
jgi:signal recognition particle receptor subunit alpha